jgi:hypothetical protein
MKVFLHPVPALLVPASLFITAGASHFSSLGSSANAQSLEGSPAHGTIDLASIAIGSTTNVEVQAGGLLNLADTSVGQQLRCRGRTDSSADVVLVNPVPQQGSLEIVLSPTDQASLLVSLPDGSFRCSERGLSVVLPSPQAGEYRIWALNHERGYLNVSLHAGIGVGSGADIATQLAQQRVISESQGTPAISVCVTECNSLLALCEQAIIDVEVACAIRARSQRARMVGTTITAVANATQSAEAALVGGAEVAGQAAETRAQRLGCDADMAEFQANCAITHAACVQGCFTQ